MAFIDDMRAKGHAVESTCRVLTEHGCVVAARTYRAWHHAGPVAARTRSDARVMDALIELGGTPESLYGRRKRLTTCAGTVMTSRFAPWTA